jgi:hypothetical protein
MRQSPGKQAASRLYLHVDALSGADADLSARISAAEALVASRLVDPQAGTLSFRTYAGSLNPPILHRKEWQNTPSS